MEQFFEELGQFSRKLEQDYYDLRATIENPALSVYSGHQENSLKEILTETKVMMKDALALERTPNMKHSMNSMVLAVDAVYLRIQNDIGLLENRLRSFGYEVSPNRIDKNAENSMKEIISYSNAPIDSLSIDPPVSPEIRPQKFELLTPPVNKVFTRKFIMEEQDSPTLESFGISNRALALLKDGTPMSARANKNRNAIRYDETPTDHSVQLEIFSTPSRVASTTMNDEISPKRNSSLSQKRKLFSQTEDPFAPRYVQIPTIEPHEMEALGYLRSQVPVEYLNQVIDDINELIREYQDLPEYKDVIYDEITYDELVHEVGGATANTNAVLLALMQLNRIEARSSDQHQRRYRIL
ncbi:hypothetical protein G9A89_008109 [Geosiphon pyriformis]|nr:hypothetical protein G9A89_008109 [Geosiphon pyriformis]